MAYNKRVPRKLGAASVTFSLAFLVIFDHPSHGGDSRWIRLRSANFELCSSASQRSARDTIREFEQVRGFFLQAFGGLPAKAMPVRLISFGSAGEYEPYRLNEYATAYYHQTADRDYIVMSHSGAGTFPIAVHEYVHLLVRHSDLKLPPWLNEGVAELYSTLRPIGDKILVGDLIPGRRQALLYEKWVPLATILAANQASPYYNEKNKAGSLYNEGWALTHMLYFRAEYRPKFGQLLRSISQGEESAEALLNVYGRPVKQIEKDLQAYMRGSSFQGALVAAKLEKAFAEIPAEPMADFDVGLMFADLMYRRGKEAAQQAALERLAQQDPKRPEPYRGLGYLALRTGRREEATQEFGKAFERGDRDAKLLWNYGRLLEPSHEKDAIRVLSELLSQDAERTDVRLELAETQLRANQAMAALDTIRAIHTVTPADAPRLFRIAVYAHLRNGDQDSAKKTAKHFLDIAKTDEDRAAAELLVSQAAARNAEVEVGPAEVTEGGKPRLRRVDPSAESKGLSRPGPPPSERAWASGRFVELDCRGKQALMIIEAAAGRNIFLIENPDSVVITAGSDGPVAMACGAQKTPVKVEVGYDPPPANQAGVQGVVRTLAF